MRCYGTVSEDEGVVEDTAAQDGGFVRRIRDIAMLVVDELEPRHLLSGS